ncbi:hypothetical protein NQ315_013435 [Exocentrus adspersus]|uniref:Tetratricopeptide repeat protein n=1 Tax=Exocentrus adspersus TaxID=1586481 RepID=A0AAV8VHB3_9CUCU|nr:hypothetical protein NQ315_013435 [Exocentrus adspersus]
MYKDSQNVAIVLYMLCFKVIIVNSKTSTLWRLNSDRTKIVEAHPFRPALYLSETSNQPKFLDDSLFDIITSTEHFGQSWVKQPVRYCPSCQNEQTKNNTNNSYQAMAIQELKANANEDTLDCGKPVNFTYYDNLVGVLNRNRHPNVPEPQAMLNLNKYFGRLKNDLEIDINAIELKLRKAKREASDASKAIECFRRALAVSPHNAEVLLNLARFKHKKKVHGSSISHWGEIFKAYGHYQEASVHLRHTLELNPGFEPAVLALKEMENMPAASLHIYTLVIIVCLVLGVLLVILSSTDSNGECTEEIKPQRHFNKAMAMRSLKGITMTSKRSKKIIYIEDIFLGQTGTRRLI